MFYAWCVPNWRKEVTDHTLLFVVSFPDCLSVLRLDLEVTQCAPVCTPQSEAEAHSFLMPYSESPFDVALSCHDTSASDAIHSQSFTISLSFLFCWKWTLRPHFTHLLESFEMCRHTDSAYDSENSKGSCEKELRGHEKVLGMCHMIFTRTCYLKRWYSDGAHHCKHSSRSAVRKGCGGLRRCRNVSSTTCTYCFWPFTDTKRAHVPAKMPMQERPQGKVTDVDGKSTYACTHMPAGGK